MTEQPWRGPVLVTGTDTGVGKTIAAAAVTAAAQAAGLRVAVIKPAQAGPATGKHADREVIQQLAAPATVRVLAEYPDPFAPLVAARIAERDPLELYAVVDAIRAEAKRHDLVLIEGAGGLLVPMGIRPSGEPWTAADLAVALGAPAIVVTPAGLNTLNHTALTLEAMAHRGVQLAGVVIGQWPREPDLAMRSNITDLETISARPLAGVLPEAAGRLDPAEFLLAARAGLAPALGGTFDAATFRNAFALDMKEKP